jgi:aspartate aminotransferase-like enzyme
LLQLHQIPHHEISLDYGQPLTEAHLAPLANQGYTAFLVNMGETSTGVLYDMPMIARFCQANGLLLIVDAINGEQYRLAGLGAQGVHEKWHKNAVHLAHQARQALQGIKFNIDRGRYLA